MCAMLDATIRHMILLIYKEKLRLLAQDELINTVNCSNNMSS